MLKSSIMSTFADQTAEILSNDRHIEQQKAVSREYEAEPVFKMYYLHSYVDAHTRDRDCCHCKEQLILKGVRYECRKCNKVSLCEKCVKNSAKSGHQPSAGQKIDLSHVVRVRARLKQVKYSVSEEDRALLEPTDENQRHIKQLVHQLGLREDFCLGCLDVTPDTIQKDWVSHYKICVSGLRISAKAGCATCSIAYRGLLAAAPGAWTGTETVTWHIQKEQIKIIDEGRGYRYFFRANPGSPKLWKTLRYAPFLTASLESGETFAVMRSWIKACETAHSHEQCTRNGDAPLPRRVVYIHRNNDCGNQSPILSLQEPPVGATGKYIALSHCWGTEPVLKTTQANFSQLCSRIDFSDLPLTFRDAVRCTRALGIAYLWIDSLCIIQDNLRDWDVESAKMTSIYHDAYLVIAAGASTSDHGGLFYERPDLIRGKALESEDGSGVFDLIVQGEVPHAVGVFPSAMVGSPITSRAWCMQELILARRSISFFKEELVWECHSCLDCECGKITGSSNKSHTTDLENYESTELGLEWDNPLFGDSFNTVYRWKPYTFFGDIETILNEWRHLTVPAYSARTLSKPKDRLPAAAGIASLIATRYRQEYLAGIWLRDLKCGLLWSVSPSQQLAPAPGDYIAPSFSWASVNREVVYRCPPLGVYDKITMGVPDTYDRIKSYGKGSDPWDWESAYGFIECHLAEASVEPAGANPLGCVKVGSHIRVYGQSMRFTLHLHNGQYSLSHLQKAGQESLGGSLVFHPDCALKEVYISDPPEDRTFLQAVQEYLTGTVKVVEPWKSVNRSKTALDPGMSGDFQADVDALVLADVRQVFGEWFSNCCAFIVLGSSQSDRDSYERLGLGTWKFGDEEIGGKWKENTQYRHFKII